MKKYIAQLHYITQDNIPGFSPIQQAEAICSQGCRWLQYRTKNKKNIDDWVNEAMYIAAICDDWGTTMIINDNVEVALQVIDAQGVHLGKSDMDPVKARQQLGPDKTIGGTANSLEDIKKLTDAGVDYIGLGPFRFTNTKENLSPVLGIEGYKKIMEYAGDIPIIAIGGIQVDDINQLMKTGIHGIAVASAINLAENPGAIYKEFHNNIY